MLDTIIIIIDWNFRLSWVVVIVLLEFFHANLLQISTVIQKSDYSIEEAVADFPLPIQKEDVSHYLCKILGYKDTMGLVEAWEIGSSKKRPFFGLWSPEIPDALSSISFERCTYWGGMSKRWYYAACWRSTTWRPTHLTSSSFCLNAKKVALLLNCSIYNLRGIM